ncbi:MAG: carboxypeptidase regulatory-like domain-containing protein [Bacteroidetes bacterium]|nr:carboxypeptidase regulatory-like domain-containing protein [Bacteroidota bacterium]MCW5895452.1 carboxypeptidase regulatory-like domain-containing protein [Bacteroidota bacterium]
MKPSVLFSVLLCLSIPAFAGEPGSSHVGTSVVTSTSNGHILQRSETVAERNPLPAAVSELERIRSTPVPGTMRLNSYVKWNASDATAIAQDVTINTNGGSPFVGWNLNSPRVSFFDDASNAPLWEYFSDPQVYRNFIALSATADIVANASYHNIYLFNKNTGTVTFNFEIPDGRIGGPIAVSRDGSFMTCATSSPLSGGMHRVYAFNPTSTTPLWTFDFSDAQSTGIYGINISVDKSTVIVNGKFRAWVLNAATGAVKAELEISNTESRVAMSADASVIAIAELSGFVRTLTWSAGQNRYNQLWQYKIPPGAFTNWASAVDISADGLTIAAGSLIFLSAGYDGSIYMFDTFGDGTPNWVVPNVGDEVGQIALSDDGSIAAVATWGDLGNALPDIYIFERNSNIPAFTVNTPGSMFSIAISADGKSVAAGGKAVHARTFGNGGNVYNIGVDLGGGAIAGTITLAGGGSQSGAKVEVLGTIRSDTTDATGKYVVKNVPAGTYTVRVSKRGYVATALAGITVTGTDTTHNVNASLSQTGAAPTNLVASHSLDSRIQLSWTNPALRMSVEEKLLSADEYTITNSIPLRPTGATRFMQQPLAPLSPALVPDSVRIYRGYRSGGPYYLRKTIAGSQSSYTDSTAIPLKDYYYRVTAMYGLGESVYSNEAYGTVDSSFLQFSITTPHRTTAPTIDGVLSPGEWTDALKVDVSDVFGLGGGIALPRGSVFMYFKYDSVAQRLYIAGEDFLNTDGVQANEGFGLYFDDNNNKNFEPRGTDSLLREGNYWAYYFSTGSTVRFREIYTGGGVNAVVDTVTDAQTAFSSASGRVTGEVSIPLGFFNKNHLQVYGPDRKVGAGLFMISRDAGNAVFHGWWPQTMASVFTPSGFGEIQIPIRLLAAPKAPTNPAVAKLGNFLRVSWTDPTHGLNNEPLTVPVTMQIYRNGTLLVELPTGAQAFIDSNVIAQGWYEYTIRGSITISTQTYYGPFTAPVGDFAVTNPQLTEMRYDDGIPEAFYVVDFTYNDNKFGIRFTPQAYPARVYRVKAFTNNGFSPILVSIHEDSSGLPGPVKAGPYTAQSYQSSGVDSFLVTLPANDPPTVISGDFHVVLSFLPSSPGAPGIGGDITPPIDGRSQYYTASSGWVAITNADLIVRAFLTGQPASVNEEDGVPTAYALEQNYPNPFNPSTTIKFQIPNSSVVTLKVYDLLGREVTTLVNGQMNPGSYSVRWDATGFASGVYFCRMSAVSEAGRASTGSAQSFVQTRKLVLQK